MRRATVLWYALLAVALTLIALGPSRHARAPGADTPGSGSGSGAPACTPLEKKNLQRAVATYSQTMAANRRAYFRTHRKQSDRRAFVRRQQARLNELQRAAAACVALTAAPLPSGGPAQTLTFYPQGGILWRDLFVFNFVDLDATGGATRDFDCGNQTYDTHTGSDSNLLSFREQDIGVPVFAALDGNVLTVQDGFYDHNTRSTAQPWDNHVIIDHGNAQAGIYGHLARRKILVRRGDRVVAGDQIGWTASSGNSTAPHLHFTITYRDQPIEPWAGPCRPGPSQWRDQVPIRRDTYAWDFVLGPQPFDRGRPLPWDDAPRTGTFVTGTRTLYGRVLVANPPGAPASVRLVRPDGSVAHEEQTFTSGRLLDPKALAVRATLDVPGRWRFLFETQRRVLVDAPFDVVAAANQIVNRAPNSVSVSLWNAAADEPIGCRVAQDLVREDPDYDVVAYRYRWTVDGEVARELRSAGLADYLARGKARRGQRVECTVTPTDGRLSGPPASASAIVP